MLGSKSNGLARMLQLIQENDFSCYPLVREAKEAKRMAAFDIRSPPTNDSLYQILVPVKYRALLCYGLLDFREKGHQILWLHSLQSRLIEARSVCQQPSSYR